VKGLTKSMKRDLGIDFLKVVGLLCIILAHVNPPGILFQLRNFDVVLMILISAYLGTKSVKKNYSIFDYYFKRFKRLVIPTWVFLIFLFTLLYIFKPSFLTINKILDSLILNDGIGYVWVIRIYLIVAILIPICKIIVDRCNNNIIIISTIILYMAYELLYYFGFFNNPIILYLFAYIVPCYVLIIIANYIFDNKKTLFITGWINLVIFIIILYIIFKQTGEIESTQIQKYPFRIYYLSYALFVSSIFILTFKNEKIYNLFNNKIITFISSHSLWIYLWHILFIYVYSLIDISWIIKYILIIISSLLITIIQSSIVCALEGKISKKMLEIFKG